MKDYSKFAKKAATIIGKKADTLFTFKRVNNSADMSKARVAGTWETTGIQYAPKSSNNDTQALAEFELLVPLSDTYEPKVGDSVTSSAGGKKFKVMYVQQQGVGHNLFYKVGMGR